MTIQLDKNTFGSSKAAIVLVDRLVESNNPKLVQKVSAYLTGHNTLVRDIMSIKDVRSRNSILALVGERVKQYNPPWPTLIVTYTKNVAMSKIKKAKEESK